MALAGVASAPGAAGITSPVGGVNPTLGNGLAVSGLASMNVSVGTGLAYVPNTTAWNGEYACYNTAAFNVAIAASSSTQYRRDYIVAQVTDPGDATANWNAVAVTGTFSSSSPGALPSIPANSIPLAIVVVTPNMTVTNAGGTVQDARTLLPLPGPWLTTSSTKPSTSSPEGTLWFESDTNQLGIIINATYQYLSIATTAPDTWHDARPCAAGWSGSISGFYPPQYRKTPDGQHVELYGTVQMGSPYNGVNIFANPLPAAYRPNHSIVLPLALGSVGTSNLTTTPTIVIHSDGTIIFANLPTGLGGTNAYLDHTWPLDSSGLIQS